MQFSVRNLKSLKFQAAQIKTWPQSVQKGVDCIGSIYWYFGIGYLMRVLLSEQTHWAVDAHPRLLTSSMTLKYSSFMQLKMNLGEYAWMKNKKLEI